MRGTQRRRKRRDGRGGRSGRRRGGSVEAWTHRGGIGNTNLIEVSLTFGEHGMQDPCTGRRVALLPWRADWDWQSSVGHAGDWRRYCSSGEELGMQFVMTAGGVPAWCGAVDVKYGS